MKYFICLLLFFSVFKTIAQTREALYGEWKFESLADEMSSDKGKKASVAGLLKDYTYVFFPDNYYEAKILSVTEKGSWKLEGSNIITVSSTGKPGLTLEVLSSEPNKMKVNTNGLIVNMVRVKSITVPQNLLQKWTFAGMRVDPDDDELRAAPKDNFLDLKADGTYTVVVAQTKESGNWMYAEETKTLNLTSSSGAKQWPVVTFDANNLVLHMNTSKAEFVFVHP